MLTEVNFYFLFERLRFLFDKYKWFYGRFHEFEILYLFRSFVVFIISHFFAFSSSKSPLYEVEVKYQTFLLFTRN